MKSPLRVAGFALAALLAFAFFPPQADAESFAHLNGGFPGHFEDAALHRLLIDAKDKDFVGRLELDGQTWEIFSRAPNDLGITMGYAVNGKTTKPFSAAWADDDLKVTLGDARYQFLRTAPLDPKIANLGPVNPDPQRNWTIAIYMGADNNLEAAALADLQEMRNGMPASGVEVIVLMDRSPGYATGEGNWTGGRILRLRPGGKPEVLLKNLGEINTGNGRTFASFLTGAFTAYPAAHQAAIVWDHGGGWSGVVLDEHIPGHPDTENMLDLMDVRTGLRTAMLHATHRPLDLLAFDACLMAQLEVALQVQGCANYLVASEAVVPNEGFPYERVLPLFADRKHTPRDIAFGITESFAANYTGMQSEGTTIAAIDLAKIPDVAEALDRFTFLGEVFKETYWPAVLRALYYAESYDERSNRLQAESFPSVDIRDFVHRVSDGMKPMPLDKWVARVDATIDAAVLASRNGDNRRRSHGLAIYGPRSAGQLKARSEGYVLSPLHAANSWMTLINNAHAEAAKHAKDEVIFSDEKIIGRVDAEGNAVIRPFEANGISFTLTGNSIVEVLQTDVMRDGDGWAVLRQRWVPDPLWMTRAKAGSTALADLFMPMFKDGENKLAVELTGQRFIVSNGEVSANVTTYDTNPDEGSLIVTHAHLFRKGESAPILVSVGFDPVFWTAVSMYRIDRDGPIAERQIQPEEEDKISFLITAIDDEGKSDVVETPAMIWKKGPSLVFSQDEPGLYHTVLMARTLDGRTISTEVEYHVEENPAMKEWAESWKNWKPENLHGAWKRQLVGTDGTLIDLKSPTYVGDSVGSTPGLFKVDASATIDGKVETIHQFWLVQGGAVPTLRIIQPVADGPDLVWYGPARIGEEGQTKWIAMKALQVGGVIWRWDQGVLESLQLRPTESKKD